MRFNEKLKELRTQKGISQQELAKSIYVSRSAVAKWENGLGLPSDESMRLLAEYFCVEFESLTSEKQVEKEIIKKNITISGMRKMIIIVSSIGIAFLAALIVCVSILSASRLSAAKKTYYDVEIAGFVADIYDGDNIIDLYDDYDRTQLSDVTLEVNKTYKLKVKILHLAKPYFKSDEREKGLLRSPQILIPRDFIFFEYSDEIFEISEISNIDDDRLDEILRYNLEWNLKIKRECKLETIKIKLERGSYCFGYDFTVFAAKTVNEA